MCPSNFRGWTACALASSSCYQSWAEFLRAAQFQVGLEVRQVFYPSKDGTRVSMFLVHRKGLANDGSLRTFWMAEARDLPADLGVEWATPRELSCVIIRYRYPTAIPRPTASTPASPCPPG